jgi:Ca-activated chloride channel family protein
MDFEHDYYAILGVSNDADEQEIKRAYRQLARRYHPDVSDEPQTAERFHEIQAAYELLNDAVQREAYDHWRRQQGLDRPLPLVLRVTPSQSSLPCLGEPQLLYILIEIQSSSEVESQRLPLNLGLVLDRSTSMKGARLQQVKVAARYIVDQMGANDVLSVVAFSDRAEVLVPGRRGIDRALARAAIRNLRSGGGTELLQGLRLGLQEVERWQAEGMQSHLILLTDGQTYGDDAECLEVARLAGQQGISLTLMGVGADWNDHLLDDMARFNGASSSSMYIDSSSKIAKTFHDCVESLGNLFAQNLLCSLHFSEGVGLREVFQVSPHITRLHPTGDRILLGSLEREQPQAVIMEVLIDCFQPGIHRLLQVEASAVVPAVGSEPVRARQAVDVSFATEVRRAATIPPDIVSAMGKLTLFKMQERAMDEIELGQIEPAVNRLKTLATRLLDIGEADLARAALLEAGRLAQTGSLSLEGRKRIRYGTRSLRILPKEVHYD